MIGAERRAARRHALLIIGQGGFEAALRRQHMTEPQPRRGDVGVAGAQRPESDRQRLLEQRLRLGRLALPLQIDRDVGEADRRHRMIGSIGPLPDGEPAGIERRGSDIVALPIQIVRGVVVAGRRSEPVRIDCGADVERTPVGRSGVGMAALPVKVEAEIIVAGRDRRIVGPQLGDAHRERLTVERLGLDRPAKRIEIGSDIALDQREIEILGLPALRDAERLGVEIARLGEAPLPAERISEVVVGERGGAPLLPSLGPRAIEGRAIKPLGLDIAAERLEIGGEVGGGLLAQPVIRTQPGGKDRQRAAVERGRLGRLALPHQPARDQRQRTAHLRMIGALARLLDRQRLAAERDRLVPAPSGGRGADPGLDSGEPRVGPRGGGGQRRREHDRQRGEQAARPAREDHLHPPKGSLKPSGLDGCCCAACGIAALQRSVI